MLAKELSLTLVVLNDENDMRILIAEEEDFHY